MNKIYKIIDLFAGIGGIRRGFEMTGRFKNVLSAEINKFACVSYEHLYGDNPYNDITTYEFKNKVKNLQYDILLGGFPCQAFSIAGLKEGFEDKTRGTLFFDVASILKTTKPKAFMLENVAGLLLHEKGKTFKVILQTLDELGYQVVGTDINDLLNGKTYLDIKDSVVRTAFNFGIPQKRSRIFIMGFRKSDIPKNYKFPPLTKSNDLKLYKDLNDLLETNVDPKYYLSQQHIDTLYKHKHRHRINNSGFGYVVVNDVENPIANTIMATGASGKDRNLIRQFNKEYAGLENIRSKRGKLNDEGLRNLTPNECGKLQGFINYAFMKNGIDEFSLPDSISNTQRYKLFGNSVCIPVIKSMAEYMVKILDDLYGED